MQIEMENRAVEGDRFPRRAGAQILRWSIGYGYAPQRASYWILGLILLGTAVYWNGWKTMVPTQKDAYADLRDPAKLSVPGNYGRFHALIYSIDNSFPLGEAGGAGQMDPGGACGQEGSRRG